jgi:enoyl-[acyl-carrier protein] reductase/trans-2-enoyl-CoA reductase (NAD+)
VGLSFEKAGTATKPGTPGFYNNLSFEQAAKSAGLYAATLNGDAFSHETKAKTIEAVKTIAAEAGIPAKIDLVIYSLASPVRTDPDTGVMYKSVIKPVGAPYEGETIDMANGTIEKVKVEPATDEEIANTVKVMGGEDWELWMKALKQANVLSENVFSIAYTYIGPELSWAIYKNGTIGRAKEDLERAAKAINAAGGVRAYVSVNKAVVTRSSAVIPIIPFYISCLFRVMKNMNLHEGCIEQIARLYRERLYTGAAVPTDEAGRIRIDDWEMRDDVQDATKALMAEVTSENLWDKSDAAGFKRDFMQANGFDVPGVDYTADINTEGV